MGLQALLGSRMEEGYRTVASKHERDAYLRPLREEVRAAFAGEGAAGPSPDASNGSNGATAARTYDAKEVKVALKVSKRIPGSLLSIL